MLTRLGARAESESGTLEAVRGVGLLVGLLLRDAETATRMHAGLRDAGLLVNLTADRVLRIFPALNIPEDELDRGRDLIEDAVEKG